MFSHIRGVQGEDEQQLNRVNEPSVSSWQLNTDDKFCGLFDMDDEDDVLLGF